MRMQTYIERQYIAHSHIYLIKAQLCHIFLQLAFLLLNISASLVDPFQAHALGTSLCSGTPHLPSHHLRDRVQASDFLVPLLCHADNDNAACFI